MNKLTIETCFPDAVEAILQAEELVEQQAISHPGNVVLDIAYPDDSLSQAFTYWLAMAQGCGLIYSYEFEDRGYK